jgi:hypothetical protein
MYVIRSVTETGAARAAQIERHRASLQLLEQSNIAGAIARLRSNPHPGVAHAAQKIAARWRGTAAMALNRATAVMREQQASGEL